ncbi:MAG: alpha/beta hydrolase [Myxococcota bacterium]
MTTHAIALSPDPEPVFSEGQVTMHWHVGSPHPKRNRVGLLALPIQGGDYDVSTHFAEHFAKKGFHVLRFERRAEWLEPSREIEELGRLALQYRRDVVRGLDQWRNLDEMTATRFGLMGISMGAMVGAGVAGTDPRIEAAVLCIGGGDMADVLIRGRDTELDQYRADLAARLELNEPDLLPHFRDALDPIDSTVHAPNVDAARTLFFGARFDRVVPWRNNRLLWDALGQPKRWILPCGHYSSVAFVPLIRWLSVRHFDRQLCDD